jgi:hypothetical protein
LTTNEDNQSLLNNLLMQTEQHNDNSVTRTPFLDQDDENKLDEKSSEIKILKDIRELLIRMKSFKRMKTSSPENPLISINDEKSKVVTNTEAHKSEVVEKGIQTEDNQSNAK